MVMIVVMVVINDKDENYNGDLQTCADNDHNSNDYNH